MRWAGLGVVALIMAACDGSEACYLGPEEDGRACIALDAADTILDPGGDYAYPDPLGGSRQYRPPAFYLDLEVITGATRVAPNFRLDELAQAAKGRYAVVQTHVVDELQGMRDAVGGLRVTSGYRSPGYNAGIAGSAEYSRHMYGDAFDLQGLDASLTEVRDACEDAGASFTLLYESHVHCDWRDDALDLAFFGDPVGAAAAPAVSTAYRVAEPALDAVVERTSAGRLVAPAIGWPEGEPLRQWRAFDRSGAVVAEQTSRAFAPPAGAARVEVVIGDVLTRGIDLH